MGPSAFLTRSCALAPPHKLGSGSTAGILVAIPQSTIARSHPYRTVQACTVCLVILFGWLMGRSATSWPCHAESMGCRVSPRMGFEGGHRRRQALCVCLRHCPPWSREEAALVSKGLRLACSPKPVPRSSSLLCLPPGWG